MYICFNETSVAWRNYLPRHTPRQFSIIIYRNQMENESVTSIGKKASIYHELIREPQLITNLQLSPAARCQWEALAFSNLPTVIMEHQVL